jgi:ketosteroid isomerase-like protein
LARGGFGLLTLRSVTLAAVSQRDWYGNPAGLTDDLDVVREIYAAFAARDLDGALERFAPDCELSAVGTARMSGREGPYRGHAGIREYFADVQRLWDALSLHADSFRAVPGSVIVMGHVEGLVEGRPVARAVMWTWRLRDGRVAAVRAADMGVLPR